MFGYDFEADHQSLTEGDEPRVDVADPDASLILNKPTSEDDHGGGLRYEKGGWEYHLLRRWIADGAQGRADDAPQLVRLQVTPDEIVFTKSGEQRQLKVVAVWSDGVHEDVTSLTRFQSNDDSVANVDADGLVTAGGPGDTHVIVFYDNGVQPIPVLQPATDRNGDTLSQRPHTDSHRRTGRCQTIEGRHSAVGLLHRRRVSPPHQPRLDRHAADA